MQVERLGCVPSRASTAARGTTDTTRQRRRGRRTRDSRQVCERHYFPVSYFCLHLSELNACLLSSLNKPSMCVHALALTVQMMKQPPIKTLWQGRWRLEYQMERHQARGYLGYDCRCIVYIEVGALYICCSYPLVRLMRVFLYIPLWNKTPIGKLKAPRETRPQISKQMPPRISTELCEGNWFRSPPCFPLSF